MTHLSGLLSHCYQELAMRNRILDHVMTRKTQVRKAKAENSTWDRSKPWKFYLLYSLHHCTHKVIAYWIAREAGKIGFHSNDQWKCLPHVWRSRAVTSRWEKWEKSITYPEPSYAIQWGNQSHSVYFHDLIVSIKMITHAVSQSHHWVIFH